MKSIGLCSKDMIHDASSMFEEALGVWPSLLVSCLTASWAWPGLPGMLCMVPCPQGGSGTPPFRADNRVAPNWLFFFFFLIWEENNTTLTNYSCLLWTRYVTSCDSQKPLRKLLSKLQPGEFTIVPSLIGLRFWEGREAS